MSDNVRHMKQGTEPAPGQTHLYGGGDGGGGNTIGERVARLEVKVDNIYDNMATKKDISDLELSLIRAVWKVVVSSIVVGAAIAAIGTFLLKLAE